MDPVILETDRLLLRAFKPADMDAVHEACQDEGIQFYTPVPVPYRRADAERLVGEKLAAQWARDKDHTLGAFRKDNGALIGSYCLTLISRGVRELGYRAVKDQRGRRYSVEAARALCHWRWATPDAHRIEWRATAGNTGCCAVAEKLGFTVETTWPSPTACSSP